LDQRGRRCDTAATAPAGFPSGDNRFRKDIAMTSLRWIPGRSFGGHILPSDGARRRARQTARVLHGLDDRMLADIGVARDQIDSASRALFDRR
jgi:hypothetical protein